MKRFVCIVVSVVLLFCFVPFASAEDDGLLQQDALLTVNTALQVDVRAKACVLMDVNTGTVLSAKNENEKLYPASVTKIMSLLLVCEAIRDGKLSFDEEISCSSTAAAKGGSQIWLEPGETMTVRELLKATVIYSANDACTLLGEAVAGSEEAFVDQMNEKAKSLGMTNTHFDNCTGLDDDTDTHLTTAYDIALMSRALLQIDFITDYTTVWMDELRDGKTQLVNTNRLIRYYPGATGLKTGTTSKAGCCVSATAERDGLGLIAVVLGADSSNDRFNGARALLDYGFANYEIYTPHVDLSAIENVHVLHGTDKEVGLACEGMTDLLVNKGAGASITQVTELEPELEAPVAKGDVLGSVKLLTGGTVIAEYPLTAAFDVGKLTVSKAMLRIFRSIAKENG